MAKPRAKRDPKGTPEASVVPEVVEELSDSQKRFLDRFAKSRGNISKACFAAAVGRTTFYMWLKESALFARWFDEVEQSFYDNAEETLNRAAELDWKAAIAALERRRAPRFNITLIEKANDQQKANKPLPVIVLTPQTKLDNPIK